MINLTFPLRRAPFVTQEFGERPEYYSKFKVDGVALKGHNGVDFRAEMGCEVIACDDGFAQEVADEGTRGYGKYVKLIHSWGESIYGHLKSQKVKQGERVKRSQTIGLADSTGNSTGSHLHFGIRINPYNHKDGWGGYSDSEPYLFNGESSCSLPQWLINFLTEKQVEIGKAESVIREWWGGYNQVTSWIEKEGAWNNFIVDLAGQLKPRSNDFKDLIARAAELREYEVKTKDLEINYANFLNKVATQINSHNTTQTKILNDLIKFVAEYKPVNLTGMELIIMGIKKLRKG